MAGEIGNGASQVPGRGAAANLLQNAMPRMSREDALERLACECDTRSTRLMSDNPVVRQGAMRELLAFARRNGLEASDVQGAVKDFRDRSEQRPGAATDAHDFMCAATMPPNSGSSLRRPSSGMNNLSPLQQLRPGVHPDRQ